MPQATVWFLKNDMMVGLSGLQSSTDTSSYVTNSTNVTADIWKTQSTASTGDRMITAASLSYTTVALGLFASTGGNYYAVVQSTAAAFTSTMQGMAVVKFSQSGMDGEWRVPWRCDARGTT